MKESLAEVGALSARQLHHKFKDLRLILHCDPRPPRMQILTFGSKFRPLPSQHPRRRHLLRHPCRFERRLLEQSKLLPRRRQRLPRASVTYQYD